MKKGIFPAIVPHLIAVLVFLVVAVLYCKPALQGDVLVQSDVTQWKGSMQNSLRYKAETGTLPLWTNGVFSGMPTFQIGYPSNNYIPWLVHDLLTLYLPKPIQFFFLACICFYFLCIAVRLNPYIGIFGALSFAYATYNPVIIAAGHDTKMWSIAYMPALLGSILLIYRRHYWLGAGLTALFTSVMIAMNHPQIAYYFFLVAGIMTVFFAVRWIKEKQTAHLAKALGAVVIAGIIGLAVNAVNILSTYDYQKETIRGGASELAQGGEHSKTGLDKDYAFSYSLAIPEPFVLMVPRIFGGSSDKDERGEASKTVAYLTSIGQQLPVSYYWGGMTKGSDVGTSGPPYAGAIVCLLAILGLFVLHRTHKWWILTTVLFAIVLSWGSYFEGFNSLLYQYLPLYNKFRAPSMILVIPQLLLPFLAALTLQKIALEKDKEALLPPLKKGLIAVGALFGMLLLLYFSFDFMSPADKAGQAQMLQQQPQAAEVIRGYFDALKEDRKALMMNDLLRTFVFMAIGYGLVWLLMRNRLKAVHAFWAFAVISLIDLLAVDTRYLNSDNYIAGTEGEAAFQLTAKDQEILQDRSFFRVFNVSGNAFSENFTSYHYNSVGGYHPAKLRIYQDLIQQQLSKPQLNLPVFNMLNTKYFIQKDGNGLTQQYQRNDSALGNAWFVRTVQVVLDAAAEMKALDNFDPAETAFVQQVYKDRLGRLPQQLGSGGVQLVSHKNDRIVYKATASAPAFAVFSEVFYDRGWKAYVDGKETPIAKTNYVLRGLAVPAGTHEITFAFEPASYLTGRTITTISQGLLLLVLALGAFFQYRQTKKEKGLVL